MGQTLKIILPTCGSLGVGVGVCVSVLDRADTGSIGFGLEGADDHESGTGLKRGAATNQPVNTLVRQDQCDRMQHHHNAGTSFV
jgi:hypothetical protein